MQYIYTYTYRRTGDEKFWKGDGNKSIKIDKEKFIAVQPVALNKKNG